MHKYTNALATKHNFPSLENCNCRYTQHTHAHIARQTYRLSHTLSVQCALYMTHDDGPSVSVVHLRLENASTQSSNSNFVSTQAVCIFSIGIYMHTLRCCFRACTSALSIRTPRPKTLRVFRFRVWMLCDRGNYFWGTRVQNFTRHPRVCGTVCARLERDAVGWAKRLMMCFRAVVFLCVPVGRQTQQHTLWNARPNATHKTRTQPSLVCDFRATLFVFFGLCVVNGEFTRRVHTTWLCQSCVSSTSCN